MSDDTRYCNMCDDMLDPLDSLDETGEKAAAEGLCSLCYEAEHESDHD